MQLLRKAILFAGMLASILLIPVSLFAADFYIAQSKAGNSDGSSCANAYPYTWFNTSGNWANPKTSGVIGPGDTVHLCGTITSQLTVLGGGSSGSPITVKFESGANMTSPAWPSTGAINVGDNLSYITIDGGATGTIGGPSGSSSYVNGIIQNTANGTGLANQVDSIGVYAPEAKYFTVKNLAIYNMYVRTRGGEQNGYGGGVVDRDVNGNGINHFYVTNCLMHDVSVGIASDYGTGDNTYEFSFNTVYNTNWGGCCSDRNSSSTMSGLLVHDNLFYNFTNWDDTTSDNFHHNGFYAWAESGGTITNPIFYNNTIGPGFGGQYQTSGIFVSGNVNNAAFYNNLFICGAGEYASNGMITMGSYLASTFRIYNNTFVNNTGGGNSIDISGSSVAQTLDVKNNLGYSLGSGTFIAAYSNANLTVTSDYNLVYGYSSTPFVYSSTSSGVFLNVANWKTATRGDTHTLTSNPNLSSTYQLQSGSPAIDAGTSEAAYFTTDKNGVTRPQGSAWDIGAFEFVSGSSTLSAPAGLKLVE